MSSIAKAEAEADAEADAEAEAEEVPASAADPLADSDAAEAEAPYLWMSDLKPFESFAPSTLAPLVPLAPLPPPRPLEVGDEVEILDESDIYCPATIREKLDDGKVIVSYLGWSKKWDETVEDLSRIVPKDHQYHARRVKAFVKLGAKNLPWPCTLYVRRPEFPSKTGEKYLKTEPRVLIFPAGPPNPFTKAFHHGVWMLATDTRPVLVTEKKSTEDKSEGQTKGGKKQKKEKEKEKEKEKGRKRTASSISNQSDAMSTLSTMSTPSRRSSRLEKEAERTAEKESKKEVEEDAGKETERDAKVSADDPFEALERAYNTSKTTEHKAAESPQDASAHRHASSPGKKKMQGNATSTDDELNGVGASEDILENLTQPIKLSTKSMPRALPPVPPVPAEIKEAWRSCKTFTGSKGGASLSVMMGKFVDAYMDLCTDPTSIFYEYRFVGKGTLDMNEWEELKRAKKEADQLVLQNAERISDLSDGIASNIGAGAGAGPLPLPVSKGIDQAPAASTQINAKGKTREKKKRAFPSFEIVSLKSASVGLDGGMDSGGVSSNSSEGSAMTALELYQTFTSNTIAKVNRAYPDAEGPSRRGGKQAKGMKYTHAASGVSAAYRSAVKEKGGGKKTKAGSTSSHRGVSGLEAGLADGGMPSGHANVVVPKVSSEAAKCVFDSAFDEATRWQRSDGSSSSGGSSGGSGSDSGKESQDADGLGLGLGLGLAGAERINAPAGGFLDAEWQDGSNRHQNAADKALFTIQKGIPGKGRPSGSGSGKEAKGHAASSPGVAARMSTPKEPGSGARPRADEKMDKMGGGKPSASASASASADRRIPLSMSKLLTPRERRLQQYQQFRRSQAAQGGGLSGGRSGVASAAKKPGSGSAVSPPPPKAVSSSSASPSPSHREASSASAASSAASSASAHTAMLDRQRKNYNPQRIDVKRSQAWAGGDKVKRMFGHRGNEGANKRRKRW